MTTDITGTVIHFMNRQLKTGLSYIQDKHSQTQPTYKTIKLTPGFQKFKMIVVGGSYAGNLAVWMKLMYSELVGAVLASSAPVLAKKVKPKNLESVTDTFRTYGSQECVDQINERFIKSRLLFRSPAEIERRTKVKVKDDSCEDLDSRFTYMAAAQTGTPVDISFICDFVKNCSKYDFNMSIEPDIGSWFYQKCTEFGYFQTTSSSKQMFFLEEFDEERIDQGVMNTNRMYTVTDS